MTKTKQLEYQPVKMPGINGDLGQSDDSIKKLDESMEEAESPCGWGPVQPPILQRLRTTKCVLFWLCCAGAIQGMVVNGFVNVVISNIEHRYSLSSMESGTIASCYDIASVLCLIPISYFGGLGCKPRYLGIGVLVMSLGSLIFALPHLAVDTYQFKSSVESPCEANRTASGDECDGGLSSQTSVSSYKYLFFLGQLMHGAGAAPLYTLGVTYLDENLPLASSPMYIGIYYSLAIIGPAIGYLAGGQFLNLYVDVGEVDPSSLGLTPENPKWVGAWWIGFLLSGFLALIVCIPLSGFPQSLPGSEKYKAEKEEEVYKGAARPAIVQDQKTKAGIGDILHSLKTLLFNPTFMFLNFAAACEGLLLSGFATFAPKFIEFQFSLSAASAAQYVGLAAVPAGGGGTFLGGYLVKRFDLRVPGIIRLCLGTTITSLILSLIFLVQCENVPFAGVNQKYQTSENSSRPAELTTGRAYLAAECNADCHCSDEEYDPVCGADRVMYYSPCHAGCRGHRHGDLKIFTNCSCVLSSPSHLAVNDSVLGDFPSAPQGSEAVEGKCPSSCTFLPIFMAFFSVLMFLTFVTSMPALSATLRCVTLPQRSFALGIQWIIARCLGSIPGPILFGKMFDIACQLWQKRCDEQGSCYAYDNTNMSLNILSLAVVVKSVSTLFFLLAVCLYKAPPDKGLTSEVTESTSLAALTTGNKNAQSTLLSEQNLQSNDTATENHR